MVSIRRVPPTSSPGWRTRWPVGTRLRLPSPGMANAENDVCAPNDGDLVVRALSSLITSLLRHDPLVWAGFSGPQQIPLLGGFSLVALSKRSPVLALLAGALVVGTQSPIASAASSPTLVIGVDHVDVDHPNPDQSKAL